MQEHHGYSTAGFLSHSAHLSSVGWCRGTISNICGFGAFCKLEGYLKDGLIHSSQIHEELVLSRDEDDADKIKAMGFYANRDDKVTCC